MSYVCVCVCEREREREREFRHSSLSATPWTIALQAPLSMEFSRQECWDRLPCPPPGDFPNLEIEPVSLASPALAGRFFTTALPGKSPYFS